MDLSPFRQSPAFLRLWLGSAIAGVGSQMTIVAIGLHIYSLTGQTSAVALVGVVSLGPMILAGIYGGLLADSFDRRTVAFVASIVAWSSTLGLVALAWTHVDTLWMYYALATLNAVSATIIGTTRSAIIPRLLPKEYLPAAAALSGISVGLQITAGPALAGLLVASVGIQWTYTLDAILFFAAFTGIVTLPKIIPEGERRPGFAAIRQGLAFVRHAPNIRLSFIVDILAMTFGNPRVLLPAVGAILIGGGAVTVGVLSAATAVGALLCSLFSGRLGSVRWQGRAIRNAIMVYGAFIAAFGVVLLLMGSGRTGTITDSFASANMPALICASLALAGAGAADNVSSVFRSTMLQTAVPDSMRGRTQGLFIVVVTGGPRVGDAYVGLIAATALLWLAPLLGGVVIIVVVFLAVQASRSFRHYDALNPTP
ncbi:MAG: putative permease [Glaciihabitans sp.]|nr:putative permease [Glaciihabitans sp.]